MQQPYAVSGLNTHFEYLLRLGDNALVLGQRLSEWCGHAPVLEEDLALANMALDLIGQARLLLSHAGAVEGSGRDEDQLAFLRAPGEYRNVVMVELPNGDFAATVVRNFLMSAYHVALWQRLLDSADPQLRDIAGKSLKEARYHVRHAGAWVTRLGDGTAESRRRTQWALEALWPYTGEMFDPDEVDVAASSDGIGVLPQSLQSSWLERVMPVLHAATLSMPAAAGAATKGKAGIHSEHLAVMLDEMQILQRRYPAARW